VERIENIAETVKFPELVFGIAGAVGIDIDEIQRTLAEVLKTVGYKSVPIRITAEIDAELTNQPRLAYVDLEGEITAKMNHANAVCRKYRSADTLMRFAIRAIQNHRASISVKDNYKYPQERVQSKTAYIIRQLKRPQEVDLLRRVYGSQFVLISAYGSIADRKRFLETSLKRSLPLNISDVDIGCKADGLMHRDQVEEDDRFGQNLRDTFHRADVFIDGVSKAAMERMSKRFIEGLFGKADIAPTKTEYGMYTAKSAALRSSDLSRQIGAAIFTVDGEIITQGCNEVPKAFGGTYWEGEEPDYRDVKIGYDPNDIHRKEVVRDFLERLQSGGFLSEKATTLGASARIVDALTKKPKGEPKFEGEGILADASIMDLTEYGRVVHAEMCAICDAARLGKSIKGAVLFTTTFPCHNCTKHILASGISKVVYIEPYPKSKAKILHENEVELEKLSSTRVSFIPFIGISPVRYRDIFSKGKRKRDGMAVTWIGDVPRPNMNIVAPTYVDNENYELATLVGGVASD
jgi:deoxycytidylate deaminase